MNQRDEDAHDFFVTQVPVVPGLNGYYLGFGRGRENRSILLAPRSNSGITPVGLPERYKGTSSPPFHRPVGCCGSQDTTGRQATEKPPDLPRNLPLIFFFKHILPSCEPALAIMRRPAATLRIIVVYQLAHSSLSMFLYNGSNFEMSPGRPELPILSHTATPASGARGDHIFLPPWPAVPLLLAS